MIRITHVITDINPGGAELALLRLVEATASSCDHQIIVISQYAPLRQRFELAGASVSVIGLGRRRPNPIRLLRLARAIRASMPDIVQTWMPAGDLIGGVLTRITTHAPVVWNLRNSELDPARSNRTTRIVTRTNGWLSRLVPTKIIAVGQHAADVHGEMHYDRGRMVVIRNGFSIPETTGDRGEARRELALPDTALIASRVGRYHPDKDHPALLAAWRSVVDQVPDALLVLAGEDMHERNDSLVQIIEASGLASSVKLLGRLDDPGPVYRSSDITISNSLAEGFPNVVGEAMANAVPVVATSAGDTALLVGDTGRVVRADRPVALAQAILELLNLSEDDRAQLGRKARDRIADQFSMNAMANQYLKLWQEVICVRS